MSNFKVREKVMVKINEQYYEGVIWNQNDFRPPEMEYAVMLEDKRVGDEDGLVFVSEEQLTNSVVHAINNSPHMDGVKHTVHFGNWSPGGGNSEFVNSPNQTVGDKHKPAVDESTLKEVVNMLRELPPDSPLFYEPEPPKVKLYQRKPIVVQVIQFTGTYNSESEVNDYINNNLVSNQQFLIIESADGVVNYLIEEDEKEAIEVGIGDYIIKDIKGQFYTVKQDEFEENYEELE